MRVNLASENQKSITLDIYYWTIRPNLTLDECLNYCSSCSQDELKGVCVLGLSWRECVFQGSEGAVDPGEVREAGVHRGRKEADLWGRYVCVWLSEHCFCFPLDDWHARWPITEAKDGMLMKRGRDNGQFLSRRFVLSLRDGTLKYYTKLDVSVTHVLQGFV